MPCNEKDKVPTRQGNPTWHEHGFEDLGKEIWSACNLSLEDSCMVTQGPRYNYCDFFCWGGGGGGYGKSKVFENLANNLEKLKTRIEAVIKGISKQLLEDVTKNACCHFREFIDSNGALLQKCCIAK